MPNYSIPLFLTVSDATPISRSLQLNGRLCRNAYPKFSPRAWKLAISCVHHQYVILVIKCNFIQHVVPNTILDVVPESSLRGLCRNDTFHVSLSKPFVLRVQEIEPFVNAFRQRLKWKSAFSITCKDMQQYENDEKTRSFLAVNVSSGTAAIQKLVREVDAELYMLQQPLYYKVCSWANG